MTLAERIQEKIEDMILDLASLFGKPTHYEAKLLEGAKELQGLWDAGIKAAAENMAAIEGKEKRIATAGESTDSAITESGTQFSTRDEVLSLGDAVDWMDDFSSIKNQLAKHRNELDSMDPIAEVIYAGEDNAELVKLIMEQIPKLGGSFIKRGSVSFNFDEKGANSIKTHARIPELRAASLAAPYIAKRGELIAGQKNHENNGTTSLTYAAPVIINGFRTNVGLAIQFSDNGRPRAVNLYAESAETSNKMKEAISGQRRGTGKSRVSALLTTDSFSKEKVTQHEPTVNPKIQNSVADSEGLSKGSPDKLRITSVTQSQQFKRWFGDWREYDTQTKVQIANSKSQTRGIAANADTGWIIQLSGRVRRETRGHSSRASQAAVPYLEYIEDIAEKAILLDTRTLDERKTENSLFMHSFYALADIGNGIELIKMYVEEIYDPNSTDTIKRAYKLKDIEKQPTGVIGSPHGANRITQPTVIKNVSVLFAYVKTKEADYKRFVLLTNREKMLYIKANNVNRSSQEGGNINGI